MKVFDSISHNSQWNTLEQCGIESQYVCSLEEGIRKTESDKLDRQRE